MDIRTSLCAALVLSTGLLVGCNSSEPPAAPPAPASPSAPAAASSAAPAPTTGNPIATGREPNASFTVAAQDLGIHSFTTEPEVPTRSIRLNCFPTWAAANPAPGKYDWTDFDTIMAQEESWGYTDILYTFCATPEWAGTEVKGKDLGAFGPKTSQPPADMQYWDDFVTAVVERYKGRITGYEIWNEPSSPQFYAGSPKTMATMTQRAYDIINEIDPAAYVLSASTQTHRADYYNGFFPKYVAGLQAYDWPVDGMAAHFYPAGQDGSPTDRVKQIEMFQADLNEAGAPPELPVWDTEVNYSVGTPGGEPDGRIVGKKAAAWTAQTYLDGWRTGVRKTFWYLWTADYYGFPGIQMRNGDPATKALTTLGEWVIGATFTGCKLEDNDELVRCGFDKDGETFEVAWAQGNTLKLDLPQATKVCPVFGAECSNETGEIKISEVPVRLS